MIDIKKEEIKKEDWKEYDNRGNDNNDYPYGIEEELKDKAIVRIKELRKETKFYEPIHSEDWEENKIRKGKEEILMEFFDIKEEEINQSYS